MTLSAFVDRIKDDLEDVRLLLESTETLAESLRSKINELEEEKREATPPEPKAKAIQVILQWREGEKPYVYVAARANGVWYVSGKIQKTFSWEDLISWIRAAYWHSDVYEMVPDLLNPLVEAHFRS